MNTANEPSTMPFDEPIPLVDVAALQADLDKAQRQIADYKTLIADFDNSRKRLIQDADRQRKFAHEPFARDVVAMLDNLDRAMSEARKAGDDGPLSRGVAATISLCIDILKRHGVTRIETPPGTPFDPNQHQAVMQQPATEIAPGGVVQVLQQGYLLHDRVLRPASVIVASEG